MLKNLLIIGAGGHARSVLDIVESQNEYQVVGVVDSNLSIGDTLWEYECLGDISDIKHMPLPNEYEMFVAIGDNFQRCRIVTELIEQFPKVRLATLKHANAHVSDRAELDQGVAVMAGAVINSACKIGLGAIVNTRASVDHDARVDEFASLAPGAVLGGNVEIGMRTSIGIGATISNGVHITDDVCVGAGAVVLKSIRQASVVAFGSPCRIVRPRDVDEAYL